MRNKYSFVPTPAVAEDHAKLTSARLYAADYFADAKVGRKAVCTALEVSLQSALAAAHAGPSYGTNAAIVTAFQQYEKGYLAIGAVSVQQLKEALRASIEKRYFFAHALKWGQTAPPGGPRIAIFYKENADTTVQVGAKFNDLDYKTNQPIVLGTIYHGTLRYEQLAPAAQPPNALNQVYVRRGHPNQHYIAYPHGSKTLFVRRYVVRGLNQEDSTNIALGADLQAPDQTSTVNAREVVTDKHSGRFPKDRVNDQMTPEEQVFSHTRGWTKRFISTTVTRRKAFSTRGTEFKSVFGELVVDLAFVPAAQIFDIHAPGSLAYFNTTGGDLHKTEHQGDPSLRTFHDEELLAARDVIRTRELLIRSNVPFAALRFRHKADNVVGAWWQGYSGAADVPQQDADAAFVLLEAEWAKTGRTGMNTDALPYRRLSRWYKFYEFADAGAATAAVAALPLDMRARTTILGSYGFPDPEPLGFAR